MDSNEVDTSSDASHLSMLALVREVAADAASPTDTDECLRRLRAGLIRLGFTRAGIWITDGTDSPIARGSWGTNWNGSELDEHGLTADLRTFVGAAQILRGDHVCLNRVETGPGENVSVHRPQVKSGGTPNQACVALRADNQLLAIISLDMLPSEASIDPEQVAAVEVVADHVAVAIARGRAATALRGELAERRLVEESLRVSEERQRSLFDGAPVGLYRTIPGGEIIDVNRALLELLGYATLEELKAVGVFHTFVNPDDRVKYQTLVTRDGYVKRFELQLRRRDSSVVWVEDNGRIIRDASGAAQFYEGSMQDITDRKRAEGALRESEERLRFMIEQTGDVIYRLPFNTMHYDYMSPSIERLTGYNVDDLQQIGWDAIIEERSTMQGLAVTPDYLARYRTTEGTGSFQSDYLIRTRSGEHRWLDDRSEPWRDRDGNLLGSVGILTDITERKLLENRLRQAQKMEAIGKLAGGIAHDFNNLLTVINGYADLLRNQLTVDTFPHEAASQILSAGESAAKLTEHLLAFSRQQLFTPKKLDLNALFERLGQIVKRTIGEDVEFTTILGPQLGMILADPGQVEQVVLNLVSNARDAMARGGKLTIQTANVDLDESYARLHPYAHVGQNVMVAVGDTGHGMEAATLGRIFEPFYTTKDERTVGKGAGMGLAAVHGIVTQCGGTIDVYSELGIGSTFKVYFPRIDVPTPVSGKTRQRKDLPRGIETIMVVEDESNLRTLARLLLEAHGYQVVDVEGGDQALQAAANRAQPLDLVLTDVVMPGLNGPQVADQLLRMFPDLKVVYMSGFTDDMVFRHGVISGGVNFLQKPFTAASLLRKVRNILDNSRHPTPRPGRMRAAQTRRQRKALAHN